MASRVLESRIKFLLTAQNPDGGWGYLPSQASWVEPTAYSMLALASNPEGMQAVDRAWNLLKSWQRPDGSWPAQRGVDRGHWTTALCLTLHCNRRHYDDGFMRGLKWLLDTRGSEGTLWRRIIHKVQPRLFGHDPAIVGWPWLPGTGSWVEPTCHALIALRKAASDPELRLNGLSGGLRKRLNLGEQMMLQRRAVDGGWNYGNRLVLGHELPSYPETTAVALLGLMGVPDFDASEPLADVDRKTRSAGSRLARAWTSICLRAYGREAPDDFAAPEPPNRNVHLAALEALGARGGNFRLLKTGE